MRMPGPAMACFATWASERPVGLGLPQGNPRPWAFRSAQPSWHTFWVARHSAADAAQVPVTGYLPRSLFFGTDISRM